MTLIGMSDKTYQKILNEVGEIRYLLHLTNEMVTKSMIEKVLMARHSLGHSDARSFTNLDEQYNKRTFQFSNGAKWTANRPEPKIENYPEI